MQHALGHVQHDEYKPQLHLVSKMLTGSCGLLLTNCSVAEVSKYFSSLTDEHFAKAGFLATHDFALAAGALQGIAFTLEPTLRQLGLPTRLKDGVIELLKDTNVCRQGDALTPEQCRLLTMFDIQMAKFKVSVLGHWTNGQFTDLSDGNLDRKIKTSHTKTKSNPISIFDLETKEQAVGGSAGTEQKVDATEAQETKDQTKPKKESKAKEEEVVILTDNSEPTNVFRFDLDQDHATPGETPPTVTDTPKKNPKPRQRSRSRSKKKT